MGQSVNAEPVFQTGTRGGVEPSYPARPACRRPNKALLLPNQPPRFLPTLLLSVGLAGAALQPVCYVLLAGGVTMALPRSLPVKSGFGFGSQLLKQAGGKESWSLERNPDTVVRRSAVRPVDVPVYGLEITADDHSRLEE